MTQITIHEPAQAWQDVVSKKRQLQAEAISASIGGSTGGPKELEITTIAEASQLVSKISRGEVTSEDIVKAYIRNLTEIVFDDALKRAKELDAYFTEHGKTIGPLHGVPSIMWCETDNPLWGLTTTPGSKDYTPGGSTGGEAALLASDATMLGWGTDIGGSIRIPSHMMGTYGFKPSVSFINGNLGTGLSPVFAREMRPMARSLSTIRLAMEQLINAKPWELDARCAPVPWRDELYQETSSGPLTIGVLYDDNVVRPHPPLTRVLRSAVERLQAAGHEVLEWNANLHEDCIRIMRRYKDLFYTVDGGEDIRKDVLAGGEPFIPHVEKLLNRGKPISVYDYWQLNRRKWELQQAYLEKWQSIRSPKTGRMVDILLLPPMPHTSVPHGGCRWVGYTKVWNFLDYPALVIPGGQVSEEDLNQPWAEEVRGVEDEWNRKLWEDNKETMASLALPVGLQIVGRKLEEEMVLAAGKIIDDILKVES
ncbi:uncharacterized protein N0V96_003223 [Colletotrichum fioriniae]|uniref:uncharacterized protein n=1 Tax=Colletotrichum fioriniae TaxID=710243 RepID=UPI0032DAC11E|nr:hypothetical protein N0V96_003223 [Colletotrichum fioriniae]